LSCSRASAMGNFSRDSLDDELAKVAGVEADAAPAQSTDGRDAEGAMSVPQPGSPRLAEPAVRPAARGNWGLLAGLLGMVAGIVALFMFGFKDAAVYSVPIEKLLADGAVGRHVRIDGELIPGTLT